MAKHVIVGAGATGKAVVAALEHTGDEIVMVTRSGSAPSDRVTAIAGDASDPAFMAQVTKGAATLFNCANPKYHRWLTDWPPIASSLLQAAASSGAVLTTLSNLYAYGPPSAPMLPTDALSSTLPKAQVRAEMWRQALAAHERGDLRATEVRASDFIGHGSQSMFERALPSLKKGSTVRLYGNPDVVHSWTSTIDVGRTLVAAALDERAWGQPWHAVTNAPATMRSVLTDMAAHLGKPAPKVSPYPDALISLLGLVAKEISELPKIKYQFQAPFIIDDIATRAVFGLEPTPWGEIIADACRS